MAITRTTINGDLSALKTALASLGIFASVTFDDDESPTTINCSDSNGNLLLAISNASSIWSYTAYKENGTGVGSSGSTSYAAPIYLYKVGSSSAVIHCSNAKGTTGAFIVMSLTNTGTVGFAFPRVFGATSVNADITNMYVASWDDDPAYGTLLQIVDSGSPMIGNSNLLVPIPLHGTFGGSIYMPNAFFIPISQSGLRGVPQQITANDLDYLTNGYVAVSDT